MQKKAVAWNISINYGDVDGVSVPAVCALNLVYLLSSSLDSVPEVYSSADNFLWAYFPSSSFGCEEFLESYGYDMAVSGTSVYGGADGFESGELIAEFCEKPGVLHCIGMNVSGTPFWNIRDIALKIPFGSTALAEEYKRIFSAVTPKCSCIACERTDAVENGFREVPEQSPDTYFRYVLFTEDDIYLNSLSISQRKQLWLLYFREGLSPLEFDDAFSAMENNEISAFPWELALRLALEEAGITVNYDNGYCVNDRSGKRISPDFSSELAAERMFAKLIFPKKPFRT